jgi:glyoxylase I family protein
VSDTEGSAVFSGIDHIEIIPRDFERTLAFYTDVLSFSLEQRTEVRILRQWGTYTVEELAYIRLGNTMIELLKVGNPSNTLHDRWGVGYRMIAIRVVDMDQAVEYLQRKGVRITEGPATLGPTVKRAEIEDPDGLPIELRQW